MVGWMGTRRLLRRACARTQCACMKSEPTEAQAEREGLAEKAAHGDDDHMQQQRLYIVAGK